MSSADRSRHWLSTGYSLLVGVILLSLLGGGCVPQKSAKVYHVGVLSGLDFFADTFDGFKAKMTELGYVEGKTIVYDVQKTNLDMAVYKRILQKFVADKVDLIFVFPTEATLEAKAAIQGTNIPMVFANANIEGVDLVKSVREPGGNITGVRYPGPDLALKRFEILHEMVPEAKRMLIPYQRGYPIVKSQMDVLQPVAAAAGVTLIEAPASNAEELQADLQGRAKSADIGFDAILFIAEPLAVTQNTFDVISRFASSRKIPIGGALMTSEGYGTLFGVSTDRVATGKQAAVLADKIFKGIPAGTIPVASAENYLQINYKVAQTMGLVVPEGLLKQAAEVIR